jgi:beta-glucosidase
MPAYNRVYGEPCAGSDLLLHKILRGRWGFQGHVVSDCWAIVDFHANHKVTANAEESAAMALKAGCDLNCGSVYCSSLLDAVNLGLCSEADVDRALRRLLRTRFRLGMFDPAERVPYAAIPMDKVCCPEHRQLALESAAASCVLLKNKDAVLPLGDWCKNMMVGGPHAASVEALMGNYFGLGTRMTTVLEGIAQVAPSQLRIDYRKGFLVDQKAPNDADWSVFEIAKADVAVLAMGIDGTIEGEEGDAIQSSHRGDRAAIELPDNQVDYLKRAAERIRSENSKARIVVLLFSGSAVAIPEIHEAADAIIQVWYPGEAGGEAIAKILFGELSPGGRLPVSVPFRTSDLPPFDDYSMAGRTYRYMQPERMLYPFGFGLSYQQISYSAAGDPLVGEDDIGLQVKLVNKSNAVATAPLQIYARQLDGDADAPQWTLAGFSKVVLQGGDSSIEKLSIPLPRLRMVTKDGTWQEASGRWQIYVADGLPVARSRELGAPEPVCFEVELGKES